MQSEYIYYDLQTDRAYRGDYSSVANTNVPTFRYKKKKQIYWQYLASAHKTAGVFDDLDTTLAATTVTATAAIDNNAVHYYDGVPNVAITAAVPITTIQVKTLGGTPRICGRIKLTNATGETETINYNGFSLATSIYTFTLADANYVAGAQTPTYTYNTTTSTARVLEIPIVKDAAVDCTNKATGLFIITVDCDSLVYQDEIEGNTEITGTVLEVTITDASLDDLYVNTIPVRCLYKLDDDGGVAPAPDKDYLTDAENELKYVQILSGTQATLTDNATTTIIAFDKTTARAAVVDYTMVGSSGMRQGQAKISFFGAVAYVSDNYIEGGVEITGITFNADISSNNVRLLATLASTGENLKMNYKLSQIALET